MNITKVKNNRNNYGRQLANTKTLSNPLLPLQQTGPLGVTFRISSRVTRNALDRQKKINIF